VVSEDESFIIRDAIVTRVWAPKGRRPICRVTGSHERTVAFGAMDTHGRQIFRQYDSFNGASFLDFLKKVHTRYGMLYLFLDKAKQHYKTKVVREYMRRNRAALRVRWIPVGSPAFNVMEECWRQMDDDMLALRFYSSLGRLNVEIGEYLRTKRFNLNMASFLLTTRYDG
jgi:transposase